MQVTEADRQHRRVSALAYRLLAAGKLAAYEWACAHQEPWINTRLTPEQALQSSLVGFVQPKTERRVSAEEMAAAEKMARVCDQRAPWDKPKDKEDA